MDDEKLVNLMNEARMISAADNIIYPLMEYKIKMRLELACGKFRDGQTSFIDDLAYITALKDIMQELKSKQDNGNRAIQKLHERDEL